MKLETYQFLGEQGWLNQPDPTLDSSQTIIFIFSTPQIIKINQALNDLKLWFPQSLSIGCSSAGEIFNDEIFDGSLSIAVLKFETTKLRKVTIPISQSIESQHIGESVLKQLEIDHLKAVFLLSDGLNVNGSALVDGLIDALPKDVIISGGLAGDGDRFEKTWVLSDFEVHHSAVTLIAFYGDAICIGHGSKGGWDVMGIDREVTRSEDNVLYELDGKPALALYKDYLGDRAKDLPASGLLFPLAIQNINEQDGDTVRTILAIDEEQQSITFAGSIPQGVYVRLMHANFDRLIDGANSAADNISIDESTQCPMLLIAISCVGRRLVLGQRCEEEVEATLESLPSCTQQVGFYSYGEISPLASGQCDLHNQTMTLTLIGEK